MSFRRLFLACASCATIVGSVGGQRPPSALVQLLRSSAPLTRADAFARLSASPGALAALGASGDLLRLLGRENRLTYSTLEESHGAVGLSDKYGEGFGEYTAAVYEACIAYCDRHDPTIVAVFLHGPLYSRDSLAQYLAATHGPEMLPAIVAIADTGKYGRQMQAVQMLATIARLSRTLSAGQRRVLDSALVAAASSESVIVPASAMEGLTALIRDNGALSPGQRTTYHQAIVHATANKYSGIREAAIRALAETGSAADLPLLNRIAEADTARSVNRGRVRYPVREEAQRAILKLTPPR